MAEAPALQVVEVDLDTKMREAYVDYAMSVIVSRALPDVRDGLKPGQRRVLYSMYELGLHHTAPFKKSARVVGDVLGKYHPHGDAAVYDALVRMAQDFNVRYPLVDGQGNFGSIDGDNPAAMRYTEVRLTELAEELLADIEKNTVAFADNFDGSLREPLVLPGRAPLFLLNGADGIAVGMATKVPPHNLRELCEAIVTLAGNPSMGVEELTALVPGPDFPSGGIIVGRDGIDRAYATGQGRITVRAVTSIEDDGRGHRTIAVSQLPYQVNKAQLIESISELVRERKLEGIAALRDESDRAGLRIAIELKKDADAGTLLKDLYRRTKLEETFGINMLGLVEGGPHQLSLKRILTLFIEHRVNVITARTQFDLDEAGSRLHVLEGLNKALGALDTVIELIRRAPTSDAAQRALVETLDLTPAQARAILDMRLARLAALERRKIADELAAVTAQVRELEAILASPKRIRDLLIAELRDLQKRFGDERRTRIIADAADVPLSIEDLIPDQRTVVMLAADGTLKRLDQFGGRPSAKDTPLAYIACNVKDLLLLFTADGQTYGVPVHRIGAVTKRSDPGMPVTELVSLESESRATAAVPVNASSPDYLVFVTARGMIKRSPLGEYVGARTTALGALRLEEGDRLIAVEAASAGEQVLIHTRSGKAIRFPLDDVRATGRGAGAVRAIRLEASDEVVPGSVIARGDSILTASSSGAVRRAPLGDFPLQGRDGSGVRSMRLQAGESLVAAYVVEERGSLEGLDGGGKALTLDAREAPLQDRQRPGKQLAEGIRVLVPLPR
jgi:DNA gyrase subunit A